MTDDQLIRLSCPQCGKHIKARVQVAGQKIACPNCSAQFKVPGQAPAKNDDDDWLLLDETRPVSVSKGTAIDVDANRSVNPKSPKDPRAQPIPPKEPDDDDEFKLAPVQERRPVSLETLVSGLALEKSESSQPEKLNTPRTGSAPIDEELPYQRPAGTKSNERSQREDVPIVAPGDQEEFRFPCKVCGSVLYQRRSAIGKEVQCPDCYSKLIVPKPKAPIVKAPKSVPIDDEELRIAPPDGRAKSDSIQSPDVVKETLERARAVLEEEEEELEQSVYDFDTSGWLLRTFAFVRDPGAVAILLMYGLVVGLLLTISWWLESLQDSVGSGILFVAYLVLIGFAAPVISSLLANGMAVLEAAANQEKRVKSWPLFDMGEWLADSAMPFFALSIASIPGSLVFLLLMAINLQVVGVGGVLFCIWLFFPIILLSMLDNNSAFSPLSLTVWRSLKTCTSSWGGMALQNAIASFALWLIYVFARSLGPIGGFCVGFGIAFYTFFVFQQIGVLASTIANVTSLGFEKSAKGESSD